MTLQASDTAVDRLVTLCDMLTYCRPAGSRSERKFIARYILPLGAEPDSARNYHVRIDRPDGTRSRVLWSCHTDTVHRTSGRQTIDIDKDSIASVAKGSDCLGADDTAGVWLATEMIKAKVPGLYVFHYGEERGGIGSRAIVENDPARFEGYDYAIALDRGGSSDVITHQAGDRCCSDAFAVSLADQLPGSYAPCDHGVYTDTAEYIGLIRECTNISVGYHMQHTDREILDLVHIARLLDALLAFDESALVCERVAGWPVYDDLAWDDDVIDVDILDDDDDLFARDAWNDDRAYRADRHDRAGITARDLREWYETLSDDDKKFVDYLKNR